MLRAPAFYSVREFATMFNLSEQHVRNGARNTMPDTGPTTSRAKLPEGYTTLVWNGVYVVYDQEDEAIVLSMFGVNRKTKRDI